MPWLETSPAVSLAPNPPPLEPSTANQYRVEGSTVDFADAPDTLAQKTATEKSISGSRASPAADLGNMVTDIAGSISDQLSNLFGGGSPANVPDASDDGKGTRKRAQVLL